MQNIEHIYLPTRPQPDTIVGIFLLHTFGHRASLNIKDARIQIVPSLKVEETFEQLLTRNILAIDVGGGPLDHHGQDVCVSELAARYLTVENDPSIARMLQYARRDDKEGKGTLSNDAIDRAFGLSGLIASLNKTHPQNPEHVVRAILPLLEAQYKAAHEHHVVLPEEVKTKRASGEYEEVVVLQKGKKTKIVYVTSDKPSMPTFLRSQQGPQAAVVVQKAEHSNHISILTRQQQAISLDAVAALLRLRESQLTKTPISEEHTYLAQHGRVPEVPNWYYDPATNSLLNGGAHNTTTEPSHIPWIDIKAIVRAGIEIGPLAAEPPEKRNSSYYLSIRVPSTISQELLSHLVAGEQVKKHQAGHVHITLEYFGEQKSEAVENMVQKLSVAIARVTTFSVPLSSEQLTYGTPEGYSNAWFLALPQNGEAEKLYNLRQTVFTALGLPYKEKVLHITLATKQSSSVPDDAVVFDELQTYTLPVVEVELVETSTTAGKRAYKTITTFPLKKD